MPIKFPTSAKRALKTVYTQTLAFSFYLQNRINNYKQTTKSTVCVNYDYATIRDPQCSCSSVLRQQVREIPGKITTHY